MDNGFDPSTLNDPVAARVDWSPLKRGGANFCTQKLVEINAHRLEFKASIGGILFSLIFMLAGIGAVILVISKETFHFNGQTILPLGIGMLFAVIGAYQFRSLTEPVVFDKQTQTFYRGRKVSKNNMPQGGSISRTPLRNKDLNEENSTSFHDIHALQILSEYCMGSKTSYYSYELNLVLKNGQRINVVDHGSKKRLLKDAETISNFIGKPLWNGAKTMWDDVKTFGDAVNLAKGTLNKN